MKKLTLLIALIGSSISFAQQENFVFDQKITYKSTIEASEFIDENINVYFNNYLSKGTILGNIEFTNSSNNLNYEQNSYSETFLINENKVFKVNIASLENRLTIKPATYFGNNEQKPYSNSFIDGFKSLEKLNTTSTINNYNCNNYNVIVNQVEFSDELVKTTVCIDETNKIDNASILFPKANVKGLLIELNDKEILNFKLHSIEPSNVSASFDEKKEIESFNAYLEKQKIFEDTSISELDSVAYASVAIDNSFEHPFCNYYTYYDDFIGDYSDLNNLYQESCTAIISDSDFIDNKKFINSTKKLINQKVAYLSKNNLASKEDINYIKKTNELIFKDAEKFKLNSYDNSNLNNYDSTSTEEFNIEDFQMAGVPYISSYKTFNTSPISLAVENENFKRYETYIPKYCAKIEVPNFSDVTFKHHVKNYVGQVCDLYAFAYDENVGLNSTIDSMRKSILKLNELKQKQTKQDQELFDQYINNLD